MKILFVSPSWPKLEAQNPFTLPPLGPIQAAACLPEGTDASVCDENVRPIPFDTECDLVGISILFASQAPRAFEISREFRARGKKVILGGPFVALCPDEAAAHADSVATGEAESLLPRMLRDLAAGRLEKVYRPAKRTDPDLFPDPRRELLDKKRDYSIKGWEMPDLLQTSRGCARTCTTCPVPHLEGTAHRIRLLSRVVADVRRCSDLIYLVDNSLGQDPKHETDLLLALQGLGRRWISHSLSPDPRTLDLARKAGWLWVYHGVNEVTDDFRRHVRLYHDHGIAVEAAVFLGFDHHTEDSIGRMVDSLMETGVDLAEFSILTPMPNTDLWRQLEAEGRILTRDLRRYNAAHVVFQPKRMEPDRLQEIYFEACRTFYGTQPRAVRMSRILLPLLEDSEKRRRSLERPPRGAT